MASNNVNVHPINLKEGKGYIDGVEVMDMVKLSLVFTPKVWSGHVAGDRMESTRWIGGKITGTLVEYRTNNRYPEMVKKYQDKGEQPEMVFTGMRTDKGSDYYAENGSEILTVEGAVFTGDIPLMDIDADGDVVKDSVAIAAKRVA